MDKQLKPLLIPLNCPFCGVAPVVGPADPDLEGNAWGWVQCLNEGCAVQPSVLDGETCADQRGSGAYIDCAIQRWNKRA